MTKSKYLTAPLPTKGMPPSIPYIIGNECAERFSFYGMRTILFVFMTKHLVDASGSLSVMSEAKANEWIHNFIAAVYFFPVVGALIADIFLGKYRTILWLSIVYCLGHLALALDDTRLGLAWGLSLIAIGSGGIKPCVSANVGDQFGPTNNHLLEKVFGWFYFSINVGAMLSTICTPLLLKYVGPQVAFAVPGVLMLVATIVFWAGRKQYVHAPPGGWAFVKDAVAGGGLRVILRLASLYVFVAMFWALFDQSTSSWVGQAERMNGRLYLGSYEFELLSSQLQAVNPALILAFIPLFAYVIYPAMNRVFRLTPLRKMGLGFFIAAAAFATSSIIEQWIAAGHRPHLLWQVVPYLLMTAAEVMISITGLEFSYTQAPPKMKSVIMSVWLLAVAAGNYFTAYINKLRDEGRLTLEVPAYFWFFTACMLATAVIFVFVAMTYRERTYLQEAPPPVV